MVGSLTFSFSRHFKKCKEQVLENPYTLGFPECLYNSTRFLSDFPTFKINMRFTKLIHTIHTIKRQNIKQAKWVLNSALISYNSEHLFKRYFTFNSWTTMAAVALQAVFWNGDTVEATGESRRKEANLFK